MANTETDPQTNGKAASEEELFTYAVKRRYRYFDMPIMGLRVRIQSLTEREMSVYAATPLDVSGEKARTNRRRVEDSSRRLIGACLVNEDGKKICTTPQHLNKIADWDSADTTALYDACAEWVGLTKDQIDELSKNLKRTDEVSSSTD